MLNHQPIMKHLGFGPWRQGGVATVLLVTAIAPATPTAAATAATVLLDETFADNRNRWSVGNRAHSKLSIRRGRYLFEHTRAKSNANWMTWKPVPIDPKAEFRIEARLTKVSGNLAAGYGLLFGGKNTEVFKAFLITGDGRYRYSVNTSSGFKNVTGWKKSQHVRRGIGAKNTIVARQFGQRIHFFINGKLVDSAPMTKFAGNNVGFQVWRNQKIAIGKLLVTQYRRRRLRPPKKKTSPRLRVLLEDNFSDNRNRWAIADDSDKRLAVRSGYYEFEHRRERADWQTWNTAVGLPLDDDFRINTTITRVSGITNHGYGILFGFKDSNNFLSFVVSGDGHYRYGERLNGKFNSARNWVKHRSVRKGDGATNRLGIHRVANEFWLYVNGQRVARVKARRLPGTGIGFQVNRRQSIRIDRVKVVAYPRTPKTVVTQNKLPVPSQRVPAGKSPPPPPPETAPPSAQPVIPPKAPPPTVVPKAPPPAARPARQLIVAVFELEDASGQLQKDVRVQLTEYLSALLAQKGTYAVVPFAQIRDRLKASKADSYKDCYDENCQIEIGKAVAAEGVIATKLLKVGNVCAVTSTLFDLKKEATADAATADTDCATSALLGAMRTIAQRL